jgi:hypothetical protein
MRLPSLIYILSEAKQAVTRFPLALISIVTAGTCAVLLVDHHQEPGRLIPLLMISQLGLPLLLALTLLGERLGWGLAAPAGRTRHRTGSWAVLQLAGLALLVIYYFTLPDRVEGAPLFRFFQLNIGLHLLVSFIPFIGFGGNAGLWQFNKALLQRLLIGVIFSGTLFLGLSVALFALDKLFGLPLDDTIYPRLWMLVVFVFNSWYLLGGVPRDLPALEKPAEYPRILKIFAQYILATLVAIYLSILLAYMVKILITTEWPSGWIGYLVSSVAGAGLFSLVMLYPLGVSKENQWVGNYARLFYIMMLPAVGMLLLAIYKRVDQYGITENRYYLVVLAIWLVFVSIKGLIERRPNLKILPLSLCLLAFITSCGPWGAFSISRTSQTQRVEKLLVSNQMLIDEQLAPAPVEVSRIDREQISAVFDYLLDQHGPESIDRWFGQELSSRLTVLQDSLSTNDRLIRVEMSRAIMNHLDLEYVGPGERIPKGSFHFSRESGSDLLDVAGYGFAHPFSMSHADPISFEIEGDLYRIDESGDLPGVTIVAGEEEILDLPLSPLLGTLQEYSIANGYPDRAPGELLTVVRSGSGLQVMLVIFEIGWSVNVDEPPELHTLQGMLFLKR